MQALKKELSNIFDTLLKGIDNWLIDTVNILDNVSNRATADTSWKLINRRLENQINKWYLLVDEAILDTKALLKKHGLATLPPILENHIKQSYESKLKQYQKECFELLKQYKDVVASNLDDEIVEELLVIAKGVTINTILNIIKEDLEQD